MSLNRDAVGARSEPGTTEWSTTSSILYALGVGAGVEDLQYTTENREGVQQRALPTMAVTLNKTGPGRLEAMGELDRSKLVHGEHDLQILQPVQTAGAVTSVSEITGVYDKGSGAAVVTRTESRDTFTDELCWVNTSVVFVRGEGGWGGDRGPSSVDPVPDRECDRSLVLETTEDQALIYRLSGDRNPLHSDPVFARRGGFETPILHGLCTFGFAGRAVLRMSGADQEARIRRIRARFAAPCFPGDALTTSIWTLDPGALAFQVARADGTVILKAGLVEMGEPPAADQLDGRG